MTDKELCRWLIAFNQMKVAEMNQLIKQLNAEIASLWKDYARLERNEQ